MGDNNHESKAEVEMPEKVPTTISRQKSFDDAHKEDVKATLAKYRMRLREPWWLIIPDSLIMQYWEFLVFLTLIFTAFVTPFEVSILGDIVWWDWLFICNRFIDLVFFVDMIMCFFTAYHTEKKTGTQMIKDWDKIVKNYVRGWFLLDIVALVPYDFLGPSSIRSFRNFRNLRLIKLLRLAKTSKMYQHYKINMSWKTSTLSLFSHGFYLILFAHWLSCLWILTADLQPYGTRTWVDAFTEKFFDTKGDAFTGSWKLTCQVDCRTRFKHDYETRENCRDLCNELTAYELYTGACYWSVVSITSVGYGDITPQNGVEMMVCMAYILLAAFLWTWIIGAMSAIVCTGDPRKIQHEVTMDALNKYMRENEYPLHLKRRLRTFLNKSRYLAMNAQEKRLVDKMSPGLKAEVFRHRVGSWVFNLQMFRNKQVCANFVIGLNDLLVGRVYEPGEKVAWANSLFVVARGACGRRGKIHTARSSWGEDFILENMSLHDKCEAIAMTFAEILQLRRIDFFMHLDYFPDEKAIVRQAYVKIAFKRGVLKVAKDYRDQMALEQTGILPKSQSNQGKKPSQIFAVATVEENMRDMVYEQSQMIDCLAAKVKQITNIIACKDCNKDDNQNKYSNFSGDDESCSSVFSPTSLFSA